MLHDFDLAENLSPENSTVALGKNGTFSCTSMKQVFWDVEHPMMNDGIVITPTPDQEPTQALNIPGLFISSVTVGDYIRSVLTIEGSSANNFTEVSCTIASGSGLIFPSSVRLRVFGNIYDCSS